MSDNPLMVPPREEVVYIYPGDVEAELERLNAQIAEAEAGESRKPKRATDKSKALTLAEEYDAVVEAARGRARALTLHPVPGRRYDELIEEHPPRKGKKRDEERGVNVDTFFPALIREALVDPVVTAEQFEEFVNSASCPPPAYRRLVNAATDLATNEVELPKSSAVSVLRRMREYASRQQPASASAPDASPDGNQSSDMSTSTPAEPEPATA